MPYKQNISSKCNTDLKNKKQYDEKNSTKFQNFQNPQNNKNSKTSINTFQKNKKIQNKINHNIATPENKQLLSDYYINDKSQFENDSNLKNIVINKYISIDQKV